MSEKLNQINARPSPFQYYTARDLWTDEYTSRKMLEYHLNGSIDVASRTGSFIERSVAWIVTRFGVTRETAIADFGCGPGFYTSALAKRGAKVTGIDFSENSIRYAESVARQRKLDINYVVANYLDYKTDEKFDLIIMIMCDFCALSPEQRAKIFAKFRALLNPGGSSLMDVYSLKAFDEKEESATYEFNQLNGFWSSDDYYCFVNRYKYDKEKVSLDKYTIIEESKTRVVYNWLQYYSEASLRDEFETAGFRIGEVYSDVAGTKLSDDSREMAVIAGKK